MKSPTMTNLLIVSVTIILSWTSLFVCACPASPNCHCMASILFCVGANFTELPLNIPHNIKHMDLHSGALETIEAHKLGHLVDLEELTMDNNEIMDVENGTFDNITKLIKLSLNENKIQYLTPGIFSNLVKLKYLLLSGNSLRSLTGVFDGLLELESLNLDNNQISYISSFMFESLPKLYDLQLNNNQITKIHPYSLGRLPALTILALGSNPLSNLDKVFEKNTKLHYLNLTACNFTKFPSNLAPSLGYLKLGRNHISHIHRDDTSQYTNLVKLVIDENNLNHIDENTFLQMPNLTDVFLFLNNLTKFPTFPKSIKRIFLDSNNISSIPVGSFQPKTEIRLLSLRTNNIMTFDTSVFQTTKINALKLDGNAVRILHDNIFLTMQGLEHLSLNELHIHEIFPNCFLGLDTLKTLEMSRVHIQSESNILGNFLAHVPILEKLNLKGSPILANYFLSHVSVMESVVNLTYLNLEENQLSTIPPTLPWHLPFLSDIHLAGNPFHCTEDNFWLQEWYMMEPRIFRNMDKVLCHSPLDLNGRLLKDVTLLDFQIFKNESMEEYENTTDVLTTEVYNYDYDDLYGPNYDKDYLENWDEDYYPDSYDSYNDTYDNYDFLSYSTVVITKHNAGSSTDQALVTETPTIVSEKTPDQNLYKTKSGHTSIILAVVMAFSVIVFMLVLTALIYCGCWRRSRNVVHHNARQTNGTNDYVFIVSKTDIQNDTADAVPPARKLTREERGSTTSHASQDITNDTSLKVYTIEVDE